MGELQQRVLSQEHTIQSMTAELAEKQLNYEELLQAHEKLKADAEYARTSSGSFEQSLDRLRTQLAESETLIA